MYISCYDGLICRVSDQALDHDIDAEKQDAMNLFLGNYRVRKGVGPALWELPGDYHLHNITDPELKKIRKSYIRWWTPDALLPQDVLARKSFLYAQERDLERFQLHDAGYDSLEGPLLDDYENDDFKERRLEQSGDDSVDVDGVRTDKLGSNPKDTWAQTTDLAQIEKFPSEDAEEVPRTTSDTVTTKRTDSTNSTLSGQANMSSSDQNSLNSKADMQQLSKTSPAQPLSKIQVDGQGITLPQVSTKIGTSLTNPSLSSHPENGLDNGGEPGDPRSESESPFEGGLPDLKDRVAAPLARLDSSRSSVKLMSSSSSVSSMHQYFQQRNLRTTTSRSSLDVPLTGGNDNNTAQPMGSTPYSSKGEQFAYGRLQGCDDDDDADAGEGGSGSAVWEEYWEEYYRPKVRTSFKTLFAYEMHSTNRYIPPK